MYVKKDRERKYTFALSIATLMVLLTLVHFNSKILAMINDLVQKLVETAFPSVVAIDHLLLFFSHPIMCLVYALLIWFFLWGFKHKIPATWTLTMFLSGETILIILYFSNRKAYISGSFFSLMLIIYSVFIMVLPLLKNRLNAQAIRIGLGLLGTLTAIALIRLDNVSLIGIIISWLAVNAWFQVCQGQYLNLFERLQRVVFFSHSDFN